MDQLPVLPEEVWSMILNMLTSYDDLLAAHNTWVIWRSLLEKTQTLWMLPGVFPLLFEYLPRSDILNCRLVCKQWNHTINSYLESGQPSVIAPGSVSPSNNWQKVRSLEADFEKSVVKMGLELEGVIDTFQTEFCSADGTCTKNPFVSRSLKLPLFIGLDSGVLDFLDTFGVHLWSLNVSFCMLHRESEVQAASFVFGLLSRVPNLKKLMLKVKKADNSSELRYKRLRMETTDLEQFLIRNPVPRLHQLENLELKVNIDLLNQVLKKAYGPKIKKYVHDLSQSFIPNIFTILEEAVLNCGMDRMFPLLRIPYLKNTPIKRLHIRMGGVCYGIRNFRTQDLYRAIEGLKNSLVFLSLQWQCCASRLSEPLDLPFVQELHIGTKQYFDSQMADFSLFAKLKSLQKFEYVFGNLTFRRSENVWREEMSFQAMRNAVEKNYTLSCDVDCGWKRAPRKCLETVTGI